MFVLDIYSDVTRIAVSRAFGGHILGGVAQVISIWGKHDRMPFLGPCVRVLSRPAETVGALSASVHEALTGDVYA